MILGPISLVDCLLFLIFLAPQLFIQVGFGQTILTAVQALPFLLVRLPLELISHRYYTSPSSRSKFTSSATLFEDVVIRCVRFAFANIPASVGRVFFSRAVSLPFMRWRMLRHGYFRCPTYYKEHEGGEGKDNFRGVWIMHDPEQPPDFVLYYLHGGGFSMGSGFFYLEFLMVWLHLLVEAGYKNPAIFTLEYTLVPDDVYPKQVNETLSGYRHVLDTVKDASKICVGGDSAGATLVLSLLQELGAQNSQKSKSSKSQARGGLTEPALTAMPLPRMATLISPWVTIMTNLHKPSDIDYLDRAQLWKYGTEYAGEPNIDQAPASPGNCNDDALWKASSPERGFYVIYGEEEVFAPDVENFVKRQEKLGVEVSSTKIDGGIHAWPVASLFLCNTEEKRLAGLRSLVSEIRKRSGERSVRRSKEKGEKGRWSD